MITKGEFKIISGRINDIAWDADSQRLIAVGDGKERFGHCFTYDTGNSVGEISGHSSVINAVDIRPCRPYRAATVSDDNSLIFLQGPPFKFNMSVKGKHTSFIHDVKFSPNGEHIVTVGADHKIALYDGKTGEFKSFIGSEGEGHTGSIFGLSWASDSSKFVTCSADATVILWDVASGKPVNTWAFEKGVANQQVGVVFAGDDLVISLSLSGNLNYLTKDSDKPVKIVTGHQKSVTALAIADDSVFSGSYDGRVVEWSLKTGEANVVKGDGHENLVSSLLSTGSGVWSTSWDDTLKQISQSSFKEGSTVNLGSQPVASSLDGKLLAIATEKSVQLFDSSSGKSLGTVSIDSTASAVAVSEAAGYIAVGSTPGNKVTLYSTSDLSRISSTPELPATRGAPSFASFSPDGKYLAVGDATGKVTLYNVADRNVQTNRWVFNTSRITSIAWHSSGDYVVVGSSDTNIYIYSIQKPAKSIKALGTHKEGVNAVAWTSDSSFVSAGADATLKHWDVKLL